MNPVLDRWNSLALDDAIAEMLSCCGSASWAKEIAANRPYAEENSLFAMADKVCQSLGSIGWIEAFRSHPRIGESCAESSTTVAAAAWSASEQQAVKDGDANTLLRIKEGNRLYEHRFGRIFIVCASGKRPEEILQILERRLQNSDSKELEESAAQQQQIMQLRLRKWLAGKDAA